VGVGCRKVLQAVDLVQTFNSRFLGLLDSFNIVFAFPV
jgi:hypothetical protein